MSVVKPKKRPRAEPRRPYLPRKCKKFRPMTDQPFRLFDLPPEIREIIFTHLFRSTRVVYRISNARRSCSNYRKSLLDDDQVSDENYYGILIASKQAYKEAKPIHVANTTFGLWLLFDFCEPLQKIRTEVERFSHHVKRLELLGQWAWLFREPPKMPYLDELVFSGGVLDDRRFEIDEDHIPDGTLNFKKADRDVSFQMLDPIPLIDEYTRNLKFNLSETAKTYCRIVKRETVIYRGPNYRGRIIESWIKERQVNLSTHEIEVTGPYKLLSDRLPMNDYKWLHRRVTYGDGLRLFNSFGERDLP